MGVSHSLPGFPSPALTNLIAKCLIAKCLRNLVEELLSAELSKETVVRGQQEKELGKFIRLCLWGGDQVGAGHRPQPVSQAAGSLQL